MDKIKIKKILKKVYEQKGFGDGPFSACLTCKCGSGGKGADCCQYGVYADKESYDLIIKHRNLLEPKIGLKIEECFDDEWTDDTEFLGGKAIGTKTKNGTCIFNTRPGSGSEIIKTVMRNKLPKRMIPSGCRLYPITWDKGKIFLEKIRKNCVCVSKKNKTKKSIFETQKKELKDIFSFKYSPLERKTKKI
jgi:hypothetical protein